MNTFAAFVDELEKIAVRIRVMHGTSGRYPVIKSRSVLGKTSVQATDPNPPMVYMAPARAWKKASGVKAFARTAAKKHGGKAVVGRGKVDTKKGWTAFNLKPQAKKEGYTIEDARAMLDDLDSKTLKGKERGETWRELNRIVGSYAPVRNPTASAKMTKYRSV